jgi:hypothetical protein
MIKSGNRIPQTRIGIEIALSMNVNDINSLTVIQNEGASPFQGSDIAKSRQNSMHSSPFPRIRI